MGREKVIFPPFFYYKCYPIYLPQILQMIEHENLW